MGANCGECCVSTCDCFVNCISLIFERKSLPDDWKRGYKLASFWIVNILLITGTLATDWLSFFYILLPLQTHLQPRCLVGNYSNVCSHWDVTQIVVWSYLSVTILSCLLIPWILAAGFTEVNSKRWNPIFHCIYETLTTILNDLGQPLLLVIVFYANPTIYTNSTMANLNLPHWPIYVVASAHGILIIWRIVKLTRLGMCCCMCTCFSTVFSKMCTKKKNKKPNWSWQAMRWVPGDSSTSDWLSASTFCCSSSLMAPLCGFALACCILLLFLPSMATEIFPVGDI